MVKFLVIWISSILITAVMASHGSFRSCYECSKQVKNYMCNWGNEDDPTVVACCEPGSKSIYCQPSVKNKCSPTFEVSKGMFFTHCPGIDKDQCKTEERNLTLRNKPQKQTQLIKNLHHYNYTDKSTYADVAHACYYIIETPKYLYSKGTVKMEILTQKNVDLMLFSGTSVALAKEGEILVEDSEDGSQTFYKVDFEQLMILIVTPNINVQDTQFEFTYQVVDTAEVDWYWKLYLENFSSQEGQKLLYVYSTCLGIIICLFCCSICFASYYCCCKPKVYEDPDQPGRRFSRRRSSKGTGLRASIRRSMRLESIVEKTGHSFRRKSTMHKLVNVHGAGQSPLKLISPYPPGPAKILNPQNLNDEQQQASKSNQVAAEYNTGNPEEQQDQSMKQLIEN